MTKEDKLEKIIEKAEEGGFEKREWGKEDIVIPIVLLNNLLFNHDFAKAIWGKEIQAVKMSKHVEQKQPVYMLNWEYHLQRAVISENPINYFYENM